MKVPFRKTRYTFGKLVINIVEAVFTRLPLPITRLIMDALFFVLYPILSLIPSIKKGIMNNIKIAFGDELSKGEMRRIARRFFRKLFRMPGDILFYGHPRNHDRLMSDIDITGLDHMEKALKGGKGVIGLGCHMVGFMLLTIRLANSDLPFIVPTKAPRNEMLRAKYHEWWAMSNVEYIDVDDPDRAREEILKTIKENKIVYLIADERKKRKGLLVPFFGRPALTAVGAAAYTLKTEAPIIPIFVHNNGRIVIDILPPLEYEITGDNEGDTYNITLKANESIEDYIRRYPEQWIWLNPRWRI